MFFFYDVTNDAICLDKYIFISNNSSLKILIFNQL